MTPDALGSRPASDDIHARLVKVVERKERACLWVEADAITFVPRVLPKIYGDGRALFCLSTINQRPAYWVIRACSTWGSAYDDRETSGPHFGEMTDEILVDLEEEFGIGRCSYGGGNLFQSRRERMRECKCEDCSSRFVAKWPMVDGDGGCSWGRMRWPAGFSTDDSGYFLARESKESP